MMMAREISEMNWNWRMYPDALRMMLSFHN
jgi:hypothetical protein